MCLVNEWALNILNIYILQIKTHCRKHKSLFIFNRYFKYNFLRDNVSS